MRGTFLKMANISTATFVYFGSLVTIIRRHPLLGHTNPDPNTDPPLLLKHLEDFIDLSLAHQKHCIHSPPMSHMLT